MTSATGSSRQGFTLIELMVVISIMLVLASLVFVGIRSAYAKARISRSKSLIERLATATTEYQSTVGSYPPDGIDSAVVTPDGTRLMSGAALTFALTSPRPKFRRLATGELQLTGEEEAVLELGKKDYMTMDGDDLAREVVDAWSQPVHYDNVQGGYNEQSDESFHLIVFPGHGKDARESEFVAQKGPQNIGRFDIWSHGVSGHSIDENPKFAITNWNHLGDEGASERSEAKKAAKEE
ncbi:MAG: type II secretion system protein [Planctomycetota bacterium]